MKAPWIHGITLFLILSTIIPGCADDPSAKEPHLEVSAIHGALEMDRPTTVAIVLLNNASPSNGQNELDLDEANASSITALLESPNERIQVLSGPQMAGSLGPGENKTVQFMAQTEFADVGIYPLQLRLSYFRLSQVTASGEEGAPDLVFSYKEVSQEIPLPVKVVRGPKIELKEIKGEATRGRESSLELSIVNNGDEPALDLQVETRSLPPFLRAESENGSVNLDPGGSYLVKLLVFTDDNATPGYRPLPIKISYLDSEQRDQRSQELAVLVMVHNDESSVTWQLPLAGLLLLAGGYWGLKRFQSKKRKTRRTKRS
jgi:hypothetical protein